jgi:protein SCO1/2
MKSALSASLLALLLAACGNPGASTEPGPARAGGMQSGCLTRAYPEIGGPIALTTHTGAAVTEADFRGRHTLVYFGFTYCPDICPMTLQTIAAAYRALPEGVPRPQTVLITVDPERDTPEALANYVGSRSFPEGLVGLTGSPEAVRAAADAFKADYSRVEQPESLSEYTIDHTTILYLMDEDWKLRTFFTMQDDAASIAACLTELTAG